MECEGRTASSSAAPVASSIERRELVTVFRVRGPMTVRELDNAQRQQTQPGKRTPFIWFQARNRGAG